MSISTRIPRFALLLGCALVAASTLGTSATANAAASGAESAQARYRQAADAFKQKKYEDARRILQSLWDEKPTYDVAVTFVQVEYALGHHAAAANYLTFALANVPPTEKLSVTEQMKKDIAQLRELAARLDLTVSEPGADVTIDGRVVGKSPLGEFYVESGEHTVEARLGERHAKKSFKADRGKVFAIELAVSPPASSGAAALATAAGAGQVSEGSPQAPQDATPEPTASRSFTPVIIGGAATVVALGVGIGYRVAAGSSYDELEQLRAKNGPQGCADGTATPADCAAQAEASSATDSRRNISTTAFVIAGVAAAGTAVYWFWPRAEASKSSAASRRLRFGGLAVPGAAGVWMSGKF